MSVPDGAPRTGRRVGLAGAGWVSQHHLAAWRSLEPRAQVVAIADPDRNAVAARAAEYGIAGMYASVDEMLDALPLDAIDIAAPREQHAPLCRLAARRGIPILCQKPLAPTLEEARALAADVDGRARLMVHENWRFRPHYRRIAGWLRAQRIGRVRTVLLSLLSSGLVPDATGALPAIARQPMLAGLERMLLMEIMIHHVDTLRFLLGPLKLEWARLDHACAGIRGEDAAALLLSTSEGGVVSLIGNLVAPGHPARLFDRLDILGTRGAIRLQRDRLRLIADGHETEQTIDLDADYTASYLGALTHFLDRLDDGAPFETGPHDNLETLRIVEQAYRWPIQRTAADRARPTPP